MRNWWELIFGLPLVALVEWYKWSVLLEGSAMRIMDSLWRFMESADIWILRGIVICFVIFLCQIAVSPFR